MTNIELGWKVLRGIAWLIGLWLKVIGLIFLAYGLLVLMKMLGVF